MNSLSRLSGSLSLLAVAVLGCACGGMEPQVLDEVQQPGPWVLNTALPVGEPDPPIDAGEYPIGSEDGVQIEVRDGLGELVPDASCEFTVPMTGYYVLPYVGRSKVAGMSLAELQEYYRKALVGKSVLKDPRVEVFINRYRGRTVQLQGAVKASGEFTLPDTERRSLQVLLLVAGVVDSADVSRIEIFRPRELKKYVVSWWDLDAKGEKFFLEPGDSIVVPKADPILVKGEVTRQGEIDFDGKKTTFVRIVETAQLTKFSDRDILLRRRDGEGRMQEWEIDFDCVNDENLDFQLRPGDELFVRNTEISWLK